MKYLVLLVLLVGCTQKYKVGTCLAKQYPTGIGIWEVLDYQNGTYLLKSHLNTLTISPPSTVLEDVEVVDCSFAKRTTEENKKTGK